MKNTSNLKKYNDKMITNMQSLSKSFQEGEQIWTLSEKKFTPKWIKNSHPVFYTMVNLVTPSQGM